MKLRSHLDAFVAHISKRVSPVNKVLEVCEKCAKDKIAAKKEGKAVDKPCNYLWQLIGAFSDDAKFMNHFGDKFLYLAAQTQLVERKQLSKTSNQITYARRMRMMKKFSKVCLVKLDKMRTRRGRSNTPQENYCIDGHEFTFYFAHIHLIV
jgi:hypothetical protein